MSAFTNQISSRFTTRNFTDLKLIDRSDYHTIRIEGKGYISKISDPKYIIKIPYGIKDTVGTIYFLRYTKDPTNPENYLQYSIGRFYKKSDNRITVTIYCNNHETGEIIKFECYSSISDGSFWRFCSKYNPGSGEIYYKGYNYITTTFINMYLQKFIFEQMNNFNIIEDTDSIINCINKDDLPSKLKKRIETDEYVSSNTFFTTMNKVFPPVVYLKDYKKCLSNLVIYINEYIGKNDPDDNEKLQVASDIFCGLNKADLNKDIVMSDETSRRRFFTKVGEVFSALFIKYFDLNVSTKTLLFSRKFNIGTWIFNSNVYSIEITYRLTGKIYIMYYMKYKREGGTGTYEFKNILHIIPLLDSTGKINGINEYGLDERYVTGGAMINKIFDYQKQSPITHVIGHIEARTQNYRFIGDLTNYEFLP